MMVLFKILFTILIAALLLVLWVVLVPRHFWVEYSKPDSLQVHMNILFFRMRLYPLPGFVQKLMSKSDKDDTTGTDNSRKDKKEEKTSLLDNIQFSFDLVRQVVSAAKGIMKRVFRAIKFRDVSFTLPLHSADILKTQQTYGAVTSAFYSLNTFLQKHLQLYYKSPVFVADFAGRYSDAIYFYCKITASPVLLLAAAYFAYGQYKQIIENNKKSPDVTEKEITNG